MSFSIAVTVEDGTATVFSQSTGEATPPDGTYSISGHAGRDWSSISISSQVGHAAAHVNHPQPAQEV